MTTKEWLCRAQNIDREIGQLMRERRKAWDRAVSITSRLNATCVASTKDPHKYDALIEYDAELDRRIDSLYDTKLEIQKAIWAVQDGTLRAVLSGRYLEGKTWEQIAVELNYSYMQICRLHGKALAEIKDVIKCYTDPC